MSTAQRMPQVRPRLFRPRRRPARPSRLRVVLALLLAGVLAGSAGATPAAALDTARTTATTAVGGTSGWLHTSGGRILTASGQPYVIKAIAWFGMETSNCAPHGLWSIGLDAGLNQIRSLGFTTIRLPFSNECLAKSSTNSINYAVNPSLVGKSPQQLLDIFVSRAAAAGLNVILDRHRPDSAAQSQLWYTGSYSEARWIKDWKKLAARYKNNSTVIGVDLHNEPHGAACWGCGNPSTDWQAAATRAGNAVLAVNPKLLIIVEGVENQPDGTSTWWGGGLSGVAAKPVKLKVPNRVVYSPHDYPSSVFAQKWFTAANYPANLPALWDKNWGYIAKKGIAPVLLGEFGSKLQTGSDAQWMKAIVGYLATNKMSFAYWSFNPNSGDTGGIVADDWVTPQAKKVAALAPLIRSTAVAPKPVPKPTVPKPAVPKPAVPKPKPVAPKPVPKPTVAPKPKPSPAPQPGSTKAAIAWKLQSAWSGGYVADVVVTGAKAGTKSWTVTWADPMVTGVASAWGMTCTVKVKKSVTCSGTGYAKAVPAGQTIRVGLQVLAQKAPKAPKVTVSSK